MVKLTKSINCDNRRPNLTKTVSVLLLTGRMSRLYVLKRSSYNRLASGLHSVTKKHCSTSNAIKPKMLLFIFHNKELLFYRRKKYFHTIIISLLETFNCYFFVPCKQMFYFRTVNGTKYKKPAPNLTIFLTIKILIHFSGRSSLP